MQEKSKI